MKFMREILDIFFQFVWHMTIIILLVVLAAILCLVAEPFLTPF
jgi:hypothetical protein